MRFHEHRKDSGAVQSFWSGKKPHFHYGSGVTVDDFKPQIAIALRTYDKFIVCLDKTAEECEDSLVSLMKKAINAYEHRAPGLRHGIALDRHVTIILSQNDGDLPLCGIYFNLHSPYQKAIGAKPVEAGVHRGQER
jgi:hypothetical protein